jgi:hypothetical protein
MPFRAVQILPQVRQQIPDIDQAPGDFELVAQLPA